mmetsp:Transcript_12743/g.29348  ORF Transcript_12743/g.29348 Transcript_12743/m.29348 type:complete len:101 (+) Transcript_12743:1192-1494(+)
MGCDISSWDTGINETSCNLSLGLADIRFSEKELPIQVGDFNSIHVNYINVQESQKGQILQKLTAQTSGSDDKNPQHFANKLLCLLSSNKIFCGKGPLSIY